MDLQNIFYIVGIICLTLYTLLLLVVVILLFYIKKKITEIYEKINEKLGNIAYIATHPKEVAVNLGAAVADTAFDQVTRMLTSKKKKE